MDNLFEPERKIMLYKVERARIVADMPRARMPPGTTDKASKPTINQDVKTI
jgi:hypothetical protein